MALVPRRIALSVAAVAALFAGVLAPATSAHAADVSAPLLVSPVSSTIHHLKDIVLKWSPVSGATLYQVQVSPNREWTNNTVALPDKGQVVNPLFEMPVSLPNATYYWHVRAQVGGVWGPYSDRWVFVKDWESQITILQAPSSSDPTLTWAPVKDASLYLVRYCPGTCAGGSTVGLIPGEVDCFTAMTSVTPYSNGVELGGGEPITGPGAPGGQPAAGPGGDGHCEGRNLLPLSAGTAYGWELIAYDDSTAAVIAGDTGTNLQLDCEQAGTPLCDVARSFSGQAFTFTAPSAGNLSTSSTVTGLTTTWHAGSLPGTPCGLGSGACPITPTFSWSPVPGANFYLISVYRDPDLSNQYREYATSWTHFTPAAAMFDAQAGAPYYWTVAPGTCEISSDNPTCAAGAAAADSACKSGAGKSGPTLGTDASDVKVSPPGPEGDQSMVGGSVGTVSLLGTNIVTGACVIPSGGSVDQSTVKVGFGGLVTFTYNAAVAANKQQVTFRVVNPDGAVSNDSAPLTIDAGAEIHLGQTSAPASFAKRSAPITLLSPAAHAVVNGNSPTFSWRDFMQSGADGSYDVRNYELQISQDRNFDTTVLDTKDIDLTQFTSPTALLANGSYYWRVAGIDETSTSPEVLTWSPIRQLTVNADAPTISFLSAAGTAVDQALLIQLSAPVRNLTSETLKIVPVGAPSANALRGRLVEGASPLVYSFFPRVPLATGGSYAIRLTTPVYDDTGTPVQISGGPVRVSQTAPNTSAGWQYSRGWTRHSASGALSGSYMQARAGAIATLAVAGSEVTVYACKAPHMGLLTVNVAGQNYTLPLDQSFTRCGIPVWHGAIPSGVRVLTLRATSGIVDFDEVTVDGGNGASSGTGGTGGTGTSGSTGAAGGTGASN